MGLNLIGKLAGEYNTVNDSMNANLATVGTQDQAENFLGTWINEKLPEMITGLAMRVVDDGSGTIAKELIDAGTDENFISKYVK